MSVSLVKRPVNIILYSALGGNPVRTFFRRTIDFSSVLLETMKVGAMILLGRMTNQLLTDGVVQDVRKNRDGTTTIKVEAQSGTEYLENLTSEGWEKVSS